MNIPRFSQPSPRGVSLVALAAILGLAAASLCQCRLVRDNVSGVDLGAASNASARSECIHRCNDNRDAALAAEDARHRAALLVCGDDAACQDAEDQLHDQIVAGIIQDMKTCKKNCYNEGSGDGGE